MVAGGTHVAEGYAFGGHRVLVAERTGWALGAGEQARAAHSTGRDAGAAVRVAAKAHLTRRPNTEQAGCAGFGQWNTDRLVGAR